LLQQNQTASSHICFFAQRLQKSLSEDLYIRVLGMADSGAKEQSHGREKNYPSLSVVTQHYLEDIPRCKTATPVGAFTYG
jgi:hypothetical protein